MYFYIYASCFKGKPVTTQHDWTDFTVKPMVLHGSNAPMQCCPLGIKFPVFGMWQCFALMRFMFARTNHTLSSALEVSSHILLHFPEFSNLSCRACCMCTAAPSSTEQHHPPKPQCGWGTNDYGCWLQLQMLTITEEKNRVGQNVPSTNTAGITGGEGGGEQGSQTLPSHPTAVGLFWDLGSFGI